VGQDDSLLLEIYLQPVQWRIKDFVLMANSSLPVPSSVAPYGQWRFLEKYWGLAPHHLGGNNG